MPIWPSRPPRPSETLRGQDLTVTFTSSLPIPFDGSRILDEDPHADDQLYCTCRNWQFAHRLRNAGVNGIRGENRRGVGSTSLVAGQIPLLQSQLRHRALRHNVGHDRRN